MGITTNETVVDGFSPQDSVTATLLHVQQGGPTDRLAFGESVVYELIQSKTNQAVSDALAVSQVIGGDSVRLGGEEATVTDIVAINLSLSRSLTDNLGIQDFVSYFIASPRWVNPSITIPVNAGSLKLIASDSTTVTLRKPDFGDSDSYDVFRVSRYSRGHDIQVYQDPMWPKTEVLSFKFSYLDPDIVNSLLDFLKATAGDLVTLKDHFGRTWTGYIITPAGDVVQEKRTTQTAAFKFQVAPS